MIACLTCGYPTVGNPWGNWCDACGGVCVAPGKLMFRHVATVDGPGGRAPIVYDLSTSDYAFMHKDVDPSPGMSMDVDGFRMSGLRISHGSLDAVIAVSYPEIRGEDREAVVQLSAAPSADEGERALVLRSL